MFPVIHQPPASPLLIEVLIDLLLSQELRFVTRDHLLGSHSILRCAHPCHGPERTVRLRAQLTVIARHHALLASLLLNLCCPPDLGKRFDQRLIEPALLSSE